MKRIIILSFVLLVLFGGVLRVSASEVYEPVSASEFYISLRSSGKIEVQSMQKSGGWASYYNVYKIPASSLPDNYSLLLSTGVKGTIRFFWCIEDFELPKSAFYLFDTNTKDFELYTGTIELNNVSASSVTILADEVMELNPDVVS